MFGWLSKKRISRGAKGRLSRAETFRTPRFETLDDRRMLSISFVNTPSSLTVDAGAPLPVALNTTGNSGAVNFSYSVTNSSGNSSTLLSTTDETSDTTTAGTPNVVQISVTTAGNAAATGTMTFQLYGNDTAIEPAVAQFEKLVGSGFYNSPQENFFRVIPGAIQGGDPTNTGTGGSGTTFDDYFDPNLRFTAGGVLALAKSTDDTNGSQFFVTTEAVRSYDFNYTIVGFLTSGNSVLQAIDAVQTGGSAGTTPDTAVVINSINTYTDNQDGEVLLSAPTSAAGNNVNLKVTATDASGNTTSETIPVSIVTDSSAAIEPPFFTRPFTGASAAADGTENTAFTYQIPAPTAIGGSEGSTVYYAATVASQFASDVEASTNSATGVVTLTPLNGFTGVASMTVTVAYNQTDAEDSSEAESDNQQIPIEISPTAPSAPQLTLAAGTGTGDLTDLNNSAAGKTLQFTVGGVASGADVQVFSDGTLIGSATAAGTSVVVTTNGTTTLSDGTHAITATQTLENKAVDVGNLNTTADLASATSAPLSITVDTVAPQFDFTPVTSATVGVAYTCPVTTSTDTAGAVTYQLAQPPTGMTINANSGLISWTPTVGQGPNVNVTVEAKDPAGNTAEKSFTIALATPHSAPVLDEASPSLGTTHDNAPLTTDLAAFINDGMGTTHITEANGNAVLGGIGLTGVTGKGVWEYSLDGKTFTPLETTVSASSALLLPPTAILRYVPDGSDGETATISYCAWDESSGSSGSYANTTTNGGTTAFSTASDTASLTVEATTDNVVLTAAMPKLGSTTNSTPITVSLTGTFINNGGGTTIISDSNSKGVTGGIALIGATGQGTWDYSLDGTTFTPLPTVGLTSALLLPATADLRYTPDGKDSETPTITYYAWDQTSGSAAGSVDLSAAGATGGTTAYSFLTDTASLTVNDAPVLTPAAPSLASVNAATAKTITLSGTFINNSSGTTTITDADTNAVLGGIAVTGTTGKGTWAYSLNGTDFSSVGTVSASSALLLPPSASLRYTPDGSDAETATITYSAWDETSGTKGTYADTTTNGGTTAFSTKSDTLSLPVTATNIAPVLAAASPGLGGTDPTAAKTIALTTFINNGSGTTTVTDTNTSAVLGGIAVTGTTGKGTWAYTLDGTTFTAVGTVSASSALLLPPSASLRYTPDGSDNEKATITYRAWDESSGSSGTYADSTTNGANTAFSIATDTATLTVAGSGSLAGYVYLDPTNDGLRTNSDGTTQAGLGGVTVALYHESTAGNWTEVSGISPIQTASDGSYSFTALAAGTYQIRETSPAEFMDGKASAGKINGTTTGTIGGTAGVVDQIQVPIAVGQSGSEYDFSVQGLQLQFISMRLFLASTPAASVLIQDMHTAPSVDLAGTGGGTSGTGFSATYTAGGSAVAIAAAGASISSPDSPTLVSMTVTITNPLNGTAEILAATTTNTPITANFTGGTTSGVLALTGVADAATYATVLSSITYSDGASTPSTGNRTIQVVVDDGTVSSAVATTTITVASAATSLAD